jgi:hypothetical protein
MTESSEAQEPLDAYYVWALCDLWPLEDAAVLAAGDAPPQLGSEKAREPVSKGARAIYELALNCAGHTLQVERSDVRDGRLMVDPRMFLTWLRQREFSIPNWLVQAVDEVGGFFDEREGTRRSRLRPEQRHRERTRGLAAYLWSQDPSIRIGSMASRRELWRITCEGHSYRQEKIHEWLQEVAPEQARKGGRPPKPPED